MTRAMLFVSLLGLVACGGGARDSQMPAAGDPCGVGDPCGGGASFAGWQGWGRANDSRFLSKGHQRAWVDVYVEPSAMEAYRAATGPYPVGTRIVKAQYAAEVGGEPLAITVMAKRERGYDADNGDWYYGVFDPAGERATVEGKVSACIDCHDQVSDVDFVFGLR